jgi:fatty-acyl-CoA synthase
VRERFEGVSGVRVLNSYGLTENTASVAVEPRDGPRKRGSSGIRLPYTRIRVVELDNQRGILRVCQPGEIGMLLLNGPGVTPGYVNPAHEAVARTRDGWLITGDLGRIDEEGYLFVTGRAKDVIIRGGHNIDPAPIEEALLQSPQVLHAAAVGKPDAYAGELPVAYVQLVPGAQATSESLIDFAARHIPERAAIPKEIFIVDRLPLTAVGKPIKTDLRRDATQRTLRTVLSGVVPEPFNVKVEADATQGTLIIIEVRDRGTARRDTMAGRIGAIMERYALAYRVDWGD